MTVHDDSTIPARRPNWEPAAHAVGGAVGGGARGAERNREYERLREQCPVAWAQDWGGYWTLSRYDDVREAATRHKEFRSGQLFPQVPQPEPVIPISLNPPEHATYRRALNKYFSLKPIAGLEPVVRAHVAAQLDPILARGSGEMVAEFCAPLSARSLASLLNMPDGAWQAFVEQSATLEQLRRDGTLAPKDDDGGYGVLAAQVALLVADRRAHPLNPDDDLISGIVAMEVDGAPLPDTTVIGVGVMMFGAGHGTTRDGLATSLHALATDPELQDRLRGDPSLIPAAVEEFLRLDPPVTESGRRAATDLERHGRTIAEGDMVSLNLAAANRDEREFPQPGECLIDRAPNRHLSFGHGVHKCVGAPLGRLQIQTALEVILARSSSFTLDGAAEPNAAIFLGGFSTLPMRFVPVR